MEQLNSVTLRGIIGSVRTQSFQDKKVAFFSLATNLVYKDREGNCVIETTWHNVTCWSGVKSIDLDSLERGKAVELEGRIKNSRYTGSDGVDRTSTEIIVRDIKILESIPKTESGV